MKFEWDEKKRKSNLKKHEVDFVDAARILSEEPFVKKSRNSGTDANRYMAVGELEERIYTVIYTMRGETCRIISARRARYDEEEDFRAQEEKNSRTLHGRANFKNEKPH